MSIDKIALNTILCYDEMKEFEFLGQIDSKQKQQEFDTDLDEFAICAPAFMKLKQLVSLW